MSNEEIVDGNKLIAEFMEDEFNANMDRVYPKGSYGYGGCYLIENLRYHTWDWLMPVWEKLGNLMYEIRRQVSVEDYNRAGIITINVLKAFQKADIDSAFNWIIEGVKWYNQNKQQ